MGWGSIAAPIIGGLFNSYNQQQNAAANAEAARITAEEQRAARKEAPEDALNYFEKIAPDSSQSERLGVSGSAVGQAMSAPSQQAIARGAQRTQATQQQSQFRLQQSQLAQQGTQAVVDNRLKEKQVDTQDIISKRSATAATVNASIANGYAPKQAIEIADAVNKEADSGKSDHFKTGSPISKSNIQTQKSQRERMRVQSVLDKAGIRLKEGQEARELTISSSGWKALSKLGIPKHKLREYIMDLQKRDNDPERTYNAK